MKLKNLLSITLVAALLLTGCGSPQEVAANSEMSASTSGTNYSSTQIGEDTVIVQSDDDTAITQSDEDTVAVQSNDASDEITIIPEETTATSDTDENASSYGSPDEFFQSIAGTYNYSSCTLDEQGGTLVIKEDEYGGMDINDYINGDESYYRFLAYSSYCSKIDGQCAYVEYPETVYSDGSSVVSYYIFEKTDNGINVYYSADSFENAAQIYHAE